MRERAWRKEGQEPDYRFSMANERTFLAWIRTALALLAGGVLLEQFGVPIGPMSNLGVPAAGLAVLAGCLAVTAYVRWRANEIAMRHSLPLPITRLHAVVAIVTMVVCAVLAGAMLWR